MASRSPKPALRRTLGALVEGAAAGRADLKWLDRAVRKAGYVPTADLVTRAEMGASVRAIVAALVDAESTAESPCCKACLHHAIDALSALASGK